MLTVKVELEVSVALSQWVRRIQSVGGGVDGLWLAQLERNVVVVWRFFGLDATIST